MSLEGKEEKEINSFIVCPGIEGKSLTAETCNSCDHYKGLQTTPLTNALTGEITGMRKSILCGYPRVLPINILYNMED
jgi:hypothetical protein